MIVAVTDTQAFLWYVSGRLNRLGGAALNAFEGAERGDGTALVNVPSIVLLESLGLIESEHVRINQRFDHWVRDLLQKQFFDVVDMGPSTLMRAFECPAVRDPFDRVIVGTALDLDLPLITTDREIVASQCVEILWD